MFKYIDDYGSLQSISALQDWLLGKQRTHTEIVPETTRPPRKSGRVSETFIDCAGDPDIVLAIQNEPKFINIIINARKQASPIAYIFTESSSNVVLVIRSAGQYPIVVVKFPIKEPYVYATEMAACFEFPIDALSSKIDKADKRQPQYIIAILGRGPKYELQYKSTNARKVYIETLRQVNKQDSISVIFSEDMIISSLDYNDQCVDRLTELCNMKVLVMASLPDPSAIDLNPKNDTNAEISIEFTPDREMIFHQYMKGSGTRIMLAKQGDHSTIIWNDAALKTQKLKIIKYRSLFKKYVKLVQSNDSVFGMMLEGCIYSYEGAPVQTYMFVKVIAKMNLRNVVGTTFGTIFSTGTQIIECYLCIPPHIK